MPVTKVRSKWSSGNLIFYEHPAVSGGQIQYECPVQFRRTFSVSADYAYGLEIYPNISGTPTLVYYVGQFIYMKDDGGATITNWMGLMLGLKINSAPSGNSAFIRIYSHGTQAVGSVLFMANSSGTPITNLLDFEGLATPISAGSDSTNVSYKIACRVHDSTKYLHLFDS